jgi:ParB-like chromosome segregation protein Spo0J
MKKVNLNDIRIDGGTQGRVVIDQQLVYQYLECMKEGDEFPPMSTVFDGATHWLVDGFHRYHAFKLLGIKQVEITYKPGTQLEAQVISFGVNSTHGKTRTNEDKRKVVEAALEHELTKDKTEYEIAKICAVSRPFVASIRNPESKQKQIDAKKKHVVKKAQEIVEEGARNSNQITNADPDPTIGEGPDEAELKANELALQADQDAMYALLESDDALKTAYEEIKRLNHLNAQLDVRIHGLMNERNEAVKLCKKLQKENDKLKGKK